MIRAFLNHHADRIRKAGYANALMNCHVRGLASIMLHGEPGNRIRLFYATADHELWRNDYPLQAEMNLAVHPHHCDLNLVLVFGRVCNVRFVAVGDPQGEFHECRYSSAINDGKGGLEQTGKTFSLSRVQQNWLYPTGDKMRADELHTIYVPKGESAAWLVFEGTEDPHYRKVCYTRNPIFNSDGMYEDMPLVEVERMLRDAAFFREPE